MPQSEGIKVWMVLVLLPLILMVVSGLVSTVGATAEGQNSGAKKYYGRPHCEVLIIRGSPPGIYYMDRAFVAKMGWMWGDFEMYCEKAADVGWTVIQRRGPFGEREDFNRPWDDYSRGFGDLNGEFWLGNEWIHKLTTDFGPCELRIELENWNGEMAWAQYSRFRVSSENEDYSIFVDGYTGNASDPLTSHPSAYFSTFDHTTYPKDDLDEWGRRIERGQPPAYTYGGGWWFPISNAGRRVDTNLNGNYNKNQRGESKERIMWNGFDANGDLKSSKMMIRSMLYRSLNTIKSNSEV